MPNQHKRRPLSVRLSEDDETWLKRFTKKTGKAVNAVLREALSDYRRRHENPEGEQR